MLGLVQTAITPAAGPQTQVITSPSVAPAQNPEITKLKNGIKAAAVAAKKLADGLDASGPARKPVKDALSSQVVQLNGLL